MQVAQGVGKPVVGALATFIGYYVVGLPLGAALAFWVRIFFRLRKFSRMIITTKRYEPIFADACGRLLLLLLTTTSTIPSSSRVRRLGWI